MQISRARSRTNIFRDIIITQRDGWHQYFSAVQTGVWSLHKPVFFPCCLAIFVSEIFRGPKCLRNHFLLFYHGISVTSCSNSFLYSYEGKLSELGERGTGNAKTKIDRKIY
jgi:hypothetical protein